MGGITDHGCTAFRRRQVRHQKTVMEFVLYPLAVLAWIITCVLAYIRGWNDGHTVGFTDGREVGMMYGAAMKEAAERVAKSLPEILDSDDST